MPIGISEMCLEIVLRRRDGRLEGNRHSQGAKTVDRRNSYLNRTINFRRFQSRKSCAMDVRPEHFVTPEYPFEKLNFGEWFFVPAIGVSRRSVVRRLWNGCSLPSRFRFTKTNGGVRVQRV